MALALRQLRLFRNQAACLREGTYGTNVSVFYRPCIHKQAARAGSSSDAGRKIETPWDFGFQCNERFLQWDDGAQAQLARIWLAQEMSVTTEEVDVKLQELCNLLPDLVAKIERCRADVLYQLLKDPATTAAWLLGLKNTLPGCNVSEMVTTHPQLMLSFNEALLCSKLEELSAALPGVGVQELVCREPLLLRADITRVLQDISRLMPQVDPVKFLVNNPSEVLDMEVSGQPSTLEFN